MAHWILAHLLGLGAAVLFALLAVHLSPPERLPPDA